MKKLLKILSLALLVSSGISKGSTWREAPLLKELDRVATIGAGFPILAVNKGLNCVFSEEGQNAFLKIFLDHGQDQTVVKEGAKALNKTGKVAFYVVGPMCYLAAATGIYFGAKKVVSSTKSSAKKIVDYFKNTKNIANNEVVSETNSEDEANKEVTA